MNLLSIFKKPATIQAEPEADCTKKAVIIAFDRMPATFYAADLIYEVRRICGTRDFDSTILRELRDLRQNRRILDWKCIDKKTAQYQKLITYKFSKN